MEKKFTIWGHRYTDHGGAIDRVLLEKDQATMQDLIEGLGKCGKVCLTDPRQRVLRHLNHLRDDHKIRIEKRKISGLEYYALQKYDRS